MLEDMLSVEEKASIEKELAIAVYRVKVHKANISEIEGK